MGLKQERQRQKPLLGEVNNMKEVRGLYWALEGKWDLRRPKRSGGYFS